MKDGSKGARIAAAVVVLSYSTAAISEQLPTEAAQRDAVQRLAPVVKFIQEGEYLMQTLALGQCVEATKRRDGQDYIELAKCYDRSVETSCNGRETCLANSTISGIERHIKNGTKP